MDNIQRTIQKLYHLGQRYVGFSDIESLITEGAVPFIALYKKLVSKEKGLEELFDIMREEFREEGRRLPLFKRFWELWTSTAKAVERFSVAFFSYTYEPTPERAEEVNNLFSQTKTEFKKFDDEFGDYADEIDELLVELGAPAHLSLTGSMSNLRELFGLRIRFRHGKSPIATKFLKILEALRRIDLKRFKVGKLLQADWVKGKLSLDTIKSLEKWLLSKDTLEQLGLEGEEDLIKEFLDWLKKNPDPFIFMGLIRKKEWWF